MSKFKDPVFVEALNAALASKGVHKLSQLGYKQRNDLLAEVSAQLYQGKLMDDYAVEKDEDRRKEQRQKDEDATGKQELVAEGIASDYEGKLMDDYVVEKDDDRRKEQRRKDEAATGKQELVAEEVQSTLELNRELVKQVMVNRGITEAFDEEAYEQMINEATLLLEGYLATGARRFVKGKIATGISAAAGAAVGAVGGPLGVVMGAGAGAAIGSTIASLHLIFGFISDLRTVSTLKDDAATTELINKIRGKLGDIDLMTEYKKANAVSDLRTKISYFQNLSDGKNEEVVKNADRVISVLNSLVARLRSVKTVEEGMSYLSEFYSDHPYDYIDDYEVITSDDRLDNKDKMGIRQDGIAWARAIAGQKNDDVSVYNKTSDLTFIKNKETVLKEAYDLSTVMPRLLEMKDIYYVMRDKLYYQSEVSIEEAEGLLNKAALYYKDLYEAAMDMQLDPIERANICELTRICNFVMFNASHLNTGEKRLPRPNTLNEDYTNPQFDVQTDEDKRRDERQHMTDVDGGQEAVQSGVDTPEPAVINPPSELKDLSVGTSKLTFIRPAEYSKTSSYSTNPELFVPTQESVSFIKKK